MLMIAGFYVALVAATGVSFHGIYFVLDTVVSCHQVFTYMESFDSQCYILSGLEYDLLGPLG